MSDEQQTIRERIAIIDSAMDKIAISGQSYKIGNRQLTRANLSELQTLRDNLVAQLGKQENGHLIQGVSVAFFDGR